MSPESFQGFVTETEIFSAHDSNTLTAGIQRRVCKSLKCSENTIDFGGFLAALLICAQIKNNDTFKRSTAILSSADPLQELFSRKILPFAVKMEYKSILKDLLCGGPFVFLERTSQRHVQGVQEVLH